MGDTQQPGAKRARVIPVAAGTHPQPQVERGIQFPGIPGALLFDVRPPHTGNVHWPLSNIKYMADVLRFKGTTEQVYLIVDPRSVFVHKDTDGKLWYMRDHKSTAEALQTRATVSLVFNQELRRRLGNRRATTITDIQFRATAATKVRFRLPISLLRSAILRPVSSNFANADHIKDALLRVQHTLVVPQDGALVYNSFFEDYPDVATAQDNWDAHALTNATAIVLGSRHLIQYNAGRIVQDARFFAAFRSNLPQILCLYLLKIRARCWDTFNRVAVEDSTGRKEYHYSTRQGAYVDPDTNNPHHIATRCTLLPFEDNSADVLTEETEGVLFQAFESGVQQPGALLGALPTIPPCILHFYGAGPKDAPPPVRDNLARAQCARFVSMIARAMDLSPYDIIDHAYLWTVLNKRRTNHYKKQVQHGGYVKLWLCSKTSRNPQKKGVTCLSCPRACGRPNSISGIRELENATPATLCGVTPA